MSVHTKRSRVHRRELEKARRRLMKEFNSLSEGNSTDKLSDQETEILTKIRLINTILGQI